MNLIKKTTASIALLAITSGLFVNGASAYSKAELEAATFLAAKGIVVKQTNPSNYQLDREVLRQEIAALARGRAEVNKTSTCTNMFSDVSSSNPNTWACYTVEALANADLIAKNSKFRPEDRITKAEAVGMIVKAAYGDEYAYDSSKEGDWQKQVVDFAVSKNIVSNFTNYTTNATRGFVFETTHRTYGSDVVCDILGDCDNNDKEDNIVRPDSNLFVELSPLSPSNGNVAANSNRAELLAFTVTAGKEDVTLNRASLKFTGLGDDSIVTKLAIYSDGVKMTKGDKTFNSRGEALLSFERDMVVKAGETKTLVVTSTIDVPDNTTYNQTVRVALTKLESSANVKGDELSGATLTPIATSNKGKADVDTVAANGRLYIWEDNIIYNFTVKETTRKEDIVVKSVTFAEATNDDNISNAVDLDNLSNLSLIVDGKKVDASFTYLKSKIVATLNETVKAGQKSNFVLKGQATDDLNKTLVLKLDELYAIGATTNISVESNDLDSLKVTTKDIRGTSVNFAFNRNGSNEISADTKDVTVGELVFVTTSDYIAKLKVTVSGNVQDSDAKDTFENLSLNLEEFTKNDNNSSDTSYEYTLSDVYLDKGTTTLPLTLDVTDKATDWNNLTFKVEVEGLEEANLGEKLTNLSSVLNNTELSKKVTVREPKFKLSPENANITAVVPKGNQQVVLYKGRIDLAGGQDITLDSLTFKSNNGVNLLDYVSGATLNIGGKTFSWDVNNSTINFSSIYAKIQKNSKSVAALLTVTLKDKELTGPVTLEVVAVQDSTSVSSDNVSEIIKEVSNAVSTKVNLLTQTTLDIVNVTNQLDDEVLAGTNWVKIASFKIRETNSDIYMDSFEVRYVAGSTDTISSALSNIKLYDGTNLVAEGGYVNDGSIIFDNFTLPQSGNDRTMNIVADIAKIDTAGGQTASYIWKIHFDQVKVSSSDITDTNFTINTEEVEIVPAVVTMSVVDNFNTDGDSQAKVKVTVNTGNNEINDVILKEIDLRSTNPLSISIFKVNGSSMTEATPVVEDNQYSYDSDSGLFTLNKEVTNLSNFEFDILIGNTTTTWPVVLEDIKLAFDSIEVTSANTDLSLGTYNQ